MLFRSHKEFLQEELREAKDCIEKLCSSQVNIFCYPEGKYDDFVISEVSKIFDYAMAINGENTKYSISRTNGNAL